MNLNCLATGSSGNCYVLTDEAGEQLILDAGIKLQDIKRGLQFDFSKVSGVLITHSHKDHSLSESKLWEYGMDVWKPYQIENGRDRKTFGKYAVESFPLPHDDCPCCGFYIRHINGFKMLYLTDFEYCRYNFRKQNINAVLIENNWSKEFVDVTAANASHKITGHASSDVCRDFIETNKSEHLRAVILCHYSNAVDIGREIKDIQEMTGANVLVDYAEKGKEILLYEA